MVADSGGRPSADPDGALAGRVSRRRVLYVAGFDPASPRKYHAMFTEQAAKQAAVSGARFEIGPLAPRGEIVSGWSVRAVWPEGPQVEVDYLFLHWFDIVRQAWPKDGLGLYLRAWRALIDYYRGGVMRRALKEAPPAYLASLSPIVVSTAFLLVYAALVAAAASAAALLMAAVGWPWSLGVALALLLWFAAPWLWARLDKAFPVGWIPRPSPPPSARRPSTPASRRCWWSATAWERSWPAPPLAGRWRRRASTRGGSRC
jgi:hypothetical protein